jgi:hypothetical protein
MHSVNIQFHILLGELMEFVGEVSSKYQLVVELERFYPKAIRVVSEDEDLPKVAKQFGEVDRIWLVYKSPRSKKSEKFMLNVGRQRGRRLAQAQLGAGADNAKSIEILKSVARDLTRLTTAGMWIEAANGNVGFSKTARISEGATTAARTGKIDLVGIAFTQLFHVDPPAGIES